jgi:hypothetical protein
LKIAYIISAYKYPDQLIRLVQRLNTPSSVFLVHVDRRTDNKLYRQMVSGLDGLTNVVFLKRHRCHWGDFGHVRATLKGLAYLFNHKIDFDYLFLLTGQDYPIKSNAQIEALLQCAHDKEFISYYPFPNPSWTATGGGMRRIELWHFRFIGSLPFRFLDAFMQLPSARQIRSKPKSAVYYLVNVFFNKRTFLEGMKPFGGPGYWCITRACADFINTFVSHNSNYVKFFKFVDIPDESFFHSIILNSPFSHNVVNDNLRCIDISEGRGPRIWRTTDFERLAQSKALIARKFDGSVDSEILDLIDSKLLGSPQTCEKAS